MVLSPSSPFKTAVLCAIIYKSNCQNIINKKQLCKVYAKTQDNYYLYFHPLEVAASTEVSHCIV